MADTKTKAPPGKPATTRRSFLERVGVGWALFTGASAAGLLATARFLFPNDLFEPPTRFKIGKPADFAASSDGTVDERFKDRNAIWVVRNLGEFYVLSTVCTHLGCTPNWLSAERKFKCPCHGSGFYVTGINFEGPAPRPLERFRISLAPDGQIEVDKSQKYQQELGQWADPNAFLKIPFVG
jgi:cytochrome b6-f complex iron-sulfur subunit